MVFQNVCGWYVDHYAIKVQFDVVYWRFCVNRNKVMLLDLVQIAKNKLQEGNERLSVHDAIRGLRYRFYLEKL